MATAFIQEALYVHEKAHLSDSDVARATGASSSAVRAWFNETRSPSGKRAERLAELSALVERLVQVIDPAYIPVWMRKPIPALGDEKPLDLIAKGEYRRVSEIVSGLESPVAT